MSIQSVAASAKRALQYTGPKARKGDVFVLEQTSSYTSANYKRTTVKSYAFAIVAKAGRDGLVQAWTKLGAPCVNPVDVKLERVMLITDPDRQAAAREIYTAELSNYFTSTDAIRSLVLDRVEALR